MIAGSRELPRQKLLISVLTAKGMVPSIWTGHASPRRIWASPSIVIGFRNTQAIGHCRKQTSSEAVW